jgi:hypothetical protein
MKTFRFYFYWSVFGVALLVSITNLAKVTSTNLLLLTVFAVVACLGYYTQEKISHWLDKYLIEKIHDFYRVKGVNPPERIDKFRRFVFGVAVTCLWASAGIDFTTMFISGESFNGKVNIPLNDLALYLTLLSILPEIFWAFNYWVNDALKELSKK